MQNGTQVTYWTWKYDDIYILYNYACTFDFDVCFFWSVGIVFQKHPESK